MSSLARSLPPLRLEVHFEKWEFEARHHLTASDAATLSIAELVATAGDGALDGLTGMRLGYTSTRGDEALRAAIAATYHDLDPEDVWCAPAPRRRCSGRCRCSSARATMPWSRCRTTSRWSRPRW